MAQAQKSATDVKRPPEPDQKSKTEWRKPQWRARNVRTHC